MAEMQDYNLLYHTAVLFAVTFKWILDFDGTMNNKERL